MTTDFVTTDFVTTDFSQQYVDLAYAHNKPEATGIIRTYPDDFQVTEELGFDLMGQGEHLFLEIEKTNTNTQWLAEQLAKFAGVRHFDVGFSGLKDRHAVTRQWFSIYMPKDKQLDWQDFNSDTYKILSKTRHNKKLRRGVLAGNQFEICVRNYSGPEPKDIIEKIRCEGVPNYFGPQRFGRNGSNLLAAEKYFAKNIKASRAKRSLYLSAARSWLFNLVLSCRVSDNTWQKPLRGDVMMLSGCRSFFNADDLDYQLQQRIDSGEISPTGLLYGQGKAITRDDVYEFENIIMQEFPLWLQGLEAAGLNQDRRGLILRPSHLTYELDSRVLTLKFFLPSGCYATSLLRELVNTSDGFEA